MGMGQRQQERGRAKSALENSRWSNRAQDHELKQSVAHRNTSKTGL